MRRTRSRLKLGLPTVAVALGALAGCAAPPLESTNQYLGTWHYDQAAGTLECPDGNKIDETPFGNQTLAPGIDAPLVDVTASPVDSDIFCNFGFDIAGPVATARVGQTCKLTGGLEILEVDSWTFTLNSPTTAEEVAATTVHVTTPGTNVGDAPTTVDCTFGFTAHLAKVAKD
jgi:hypothetical protein